MKYKWDFFIAHAGKDTPIAESLYNLLAAYSLVFLDSKILLPGDSWAPTLSDAQRNSRITVVLVSARTEKAFYQQEEIAAAISMARDEKTKHRVVPVFLDKNTTQNKNIPYGLRSLHSIYVTDKNDLTETAKHLLGLLSYVKRQKANSKKSAGEIQVAPLIDETTITDFKGNTSHSLTGFLHEFTFTLRAKHRIKFEGKNYVWGVSLLILTVDGEEVMRRSINQIYQSFSHSFTIEGIGCLLKFMVIAGLTSGGMWVGEQQIMKITSIPS
jgi:hypothetical protein